MSAPGLLNFCLPVSLELLAFRGNASADDAPYAFRFEKKCCSTNSSIAA